MKIQQYLSTLKDCYKKDKVIIFNVLVSLLGVASYQVDFVRDNYQHFYLYYVFGITGLNALIKNWENTINNVSLDKEDLINKEAPKIVASFDNGNVVQEEVKDKQNFNSGSC